MEDFFENGCTGKIISIISTKNGLIGPLSMNSWHSICGKDTLSWGCGTETIG